MQLILYFILQIPRALEKEGIKVNSIGKVCGHKGFQIPNFLLNFHLCHFSMPFLFYFWFTYLVLISNSFHDNVIYWFVFIFYTDKMMKIQKKKILMQFYNIIKICRKKLLMKWWEWHKAWNIHQWWQTTSYSKITR